MYLRDLRPSAWLHHDDLGRGYQKICFWKLVKLKMIFNTHEQSCYTTSGRCIMYIVFMCGIWNVEGNDVGFSGYTDELEMHRERRGERQRDRPFLSLGITRASWAGGASTAYSLARALDCTVYVSSSYWNVRGWLRYFHPETVKRKCVQGKYSRDSSVKYNHLDDTSLVGKWRRLSRWNCCYGWRCRWVRHVACRWVCRWTESSSTKNDSTVCSFDLTLIVHSAYCSELFTFSEYNNNNLL